MLVKHNASQNVQLSCSGCKKKYPTYRPIFFQTCYSKHTYYLIWPKMVGWLCWGLTSQSTIFQSCRDGAIASWVINQYFRGVKCLAQGHNTAAVGLEPRTSRSGVRHSTTEPPRSPIWPKIPSLWPLSKSLSGHLILIPNHFGLNI